MTVIKKEIRKRCGYIASELIIVQGNSPRHTKDIMSVMPLTKGYPGINVRNHMDMVYIPIHTDVLNNFTIMVPVRPTFPYYRNISLIDLTTPTINQGERTAYHSHESHNINCTKASL